jgi:hypothetical protein
MTSEFLFSKRNEFFEPNHHAAEVYLDGRWIPVDPNFALEPVLGYGFGRTAVSKVVLKRDNSWVWSNRIPGVSRQYREAFVDVGLVLILATGYANVYKQLGYGVDRAVSNAGGGAHGVAFNQQVDYLCAFFNWQDVHGNPLSIVHVEIMLERLCNVKCNLYTMCNSVC